MKKLLLLLLLIPINTKALSMIGYDMDSNQILYSDNIHDKRPVASISKIMTAILACESGKLDDTVIIGDEINKAYGSAIYIKVGEEMSLRDLVYGLMLRSGNDAAFAIAKYVGGDIDTFIKMMNDKANELGMYDSTYNNPNGLDDNGGNISSAYDMAVLTSYAMKNSEYAKITSTKNHTVKTNMNYYDWTNKNRLLFRYKYVTGGKTGYTDVAKRTLVTTATNSNMNLVIVTLNDGNDFLDHKNLYEKLFNEYKGYYILKEGNIDIANLNDNNTYYVKNNFKYDLKDSEKDNILLKFSVSNIDNDKKGNVKIFLGDVEIGNEDIYVKDRKKVSFWEKIHNFFVNMCIDNYA